MLVPGLGMDGPGASGELLVDLLLVDRFVTGAPWSGPGTPGPIPAQIPVDRTLVGSSVFLQGLMLDLSPGAAIPFGLAEAVELRIGG